MWEGNRDKCCLDTRGRRSMDPADTCLKLDWAPPLIKLWKETIAGGGGEFISWVDVDGGAEKMICVSGWCWWLWGRMPRPVSEFAKSRIYQRSPTHHHPTTKKRAPRSYFKLNPEENTIESCPILKRSTNSSQISFFVVRTVGTMRSQTKYDGFKCNQTMQRSYLISSSQLFIMDRVRKASEIHSPPPLLVPLPPPGSEWWDGKSWLAGHYSSVHTRTYTTQPINTY